jgi:HD-GYP domain-containing protein (c-di-GMP phosphodiesterase class II)
MPRMFDMLRGKDDNRNIKGKSQKEKSPAKDSSEKEKGKASPKGQPSRNQPLNFPKDILKKGDKKAGKAEDHAVVSRKLISSVKKDGIDNQETARKIYEDAVRTVENLISKIKNNEDLNLSIEEIYSLLDKVINQLLMGDNVLNYIYEKREGVYFLPYHVVNLLLLSLFLGINMGFNKSRLKHLGLASIFCDVGYDSMRELIGQPRKLTDEEYDIMKTHVSKSLQAVEAISSINDVVKETILMHHERANGSGYPRGFKSDQINPYAKIIGLVDTYEAITHKRAYREGMDAHSTMKFMISALKNNFDHDAIKLLIDKMSIYPIGSFVKLDTGEVARVISVRPGSPLRPVVMILKDAFDQPVKEKIVIDLSKPGGPSIQSPV